MLIATAAIACSGDRPPVPEAGGDAGAGARRDYPPVPTPLEAARASVASACDHADVKACIGAGRAEDACLHGSADGCMRVASSDPGRAAIFRGRACRRGLPTACEGELDKRPLVSARGLGAYEHAVADCWLETPGVDRDRDIRGTIALTTDHRGVTTAIARISDDPLRRCIESSATRWVIDDNRDVDLLIRPPGARDPYAVGVLGGGGVVGGIIGSPGGGFGSSGVGSLGGFGVTPLSKVSIAVAGPDGATQLDVRRKLTTTYAYMLRSCHRSSLFSDPDLETDVTVRFTITPTGSVDDVSASSRGPDRLRRCIKRRARLWRFAPSHDAARFSVQIELRVK